MFLDFESLKNGKAKWLKIQNKEKESKSKKETK
jgi:hypothetical protein